jgi:hypothetical protein
MFKAVQFLEICPSAHYPESPSSRLSFSLGESRLPYLRHHIHANSQQDPKNILQLLAVVVEEDIDSYG